MKQLLRAVLAASLLGAAAAAPGAGSAVHYVSDAAHSSLEFSFTQAGAQNQGRFKSFPVVFDFAPDALTASRLEVTVDMNSLDTGDQERDDNLRDSDLFAVKRYPQAHYSATQFSKAASGYEALGKLTLRGVTRELRVPFTFRTATENGAGVGYMSGKLTIRRLDFGVGQGDWKSTEWVGNDVGITFNVRLTSAAH